MIFSFKQFLKEELRINEIDNSTLDVCAKNNSYNKTNSFEAEEMIALEDTILRGIMDYITDIKLPTFEEFLYEYEYYSSGEPSGQERIESYLEMFNIVEDIDELDRLDKHLIKKLYDELIDRIRYKFSN